MSAHDLEQLVCRSIADRIIQPAFILDLQGQTDIEASQLQQAMAAGKGDEERIRDAGAEGYLAKPVSIGPFMAAVMSTDYVAALKSAQAELADLSASDREAIAAAQDAGPAAAGVPGRPSRLCGFFLPVRLEPRNHCRSGRAVPAEPVQRRRRVR